MSKLEIILNVKKPKLLNVTGRASLKDVAEKMGVFKDSLYLAAVYCAAGPSLKAAIKRAVEAQLALDREQYHAEACGVKYHE